MLTDPSSGREKCKTGWLSGSGGGGGVGKVGGETRVIERTIPALQIDIIKLL